jgi:hypothetical protein
LKWIKDSNFDINKGGINSGVGSYGRQNKIVNEIVNIFKNKTDLNSLTEKIKQKNK